MSPAQANQPLPAGFWLKHYRITGQLSLGGFSIVYLAEDVFGEPVVIKEYLPNALALRAGESPEPVVSPRHRAVFNHGLNCFFEEGRNLTKLDHPNVVRVLNFFRAHGTAYLVLRYEEGRTLQTHIQRHPGTLEEDFIRTLFGRILNGLRAVHSSQLLHLDIKPANIYLRQHDGSPLLLDFGAARQVIGHDAPQLRTMHTPGYAAPEQYDKGEGQQERLGPWTDIYGIGASLYACLGGRPPLSAQERLHKDLLVPAVKQFAGRYSYQLLHSVDQCLGLDPLQRPQSAHALQKLLASEDRDPSPPGLVGRLRLWLRGAGK
ncbi:hypothetical protein DLREEDagrD3_10630 [Denitratisoma sp. agr-D3]